MDRRTHVRARVRLFPDAANSLSTVVRRIGDNGGGRIFDFGFWIGAAGVGGAEMHQWFAQGLPTPSDSPLLRGERHTCRLVATDEKIAPGVAVTEADFVRQMPAAAKVAMKSGAQLTLGRAA